MRGARAQGGVCLVAALLCLAACGTKRTRQDAAGRMTLVPVIALRAAPPTTREAARAFFKGSSLDPATLSPGTPIGFVAEGFAPTLRLQVSLHVSVVDDETGARRVVHADQLGVEPGRRFLAGVITPVPSADPLPPRLGAGRDDSERPSRAVNDAETPAVVSALPRRAMWPRPCRTYVVELGSFAGPIAKTSVTLGGCRRALEALRGKVLFHVGKQAPALYNFAGTLAAYRKAAGATTPLPTPIGKSSFFLGWKAAFHGPVGVPRVRVRLTEVDSGVVRDEREMPLDPTWDSLAGGWEITDAPPERPLPRIVEGRGDPKRPTRARADSEAPEPGLTPFRRADWPRKGVRYRLELTTADVHARVLAAGVLTL